MGRREALIAKFKAGGLERIRQLRVLLAKLQEGAADVEEFRTATRELHTLKGESRMLGFAGIAETAHAGESLLLLPALQYSTSNPLPAFVCNAISSALDVVARVLADEMDEAAALPALETARDGLRRLAADLSAETSTTPSPAAPPAAPLVEPSAPSVEPTAAFTPLVNPSTPVLRPVDPSLRAPEPKPSTQPAATAPGERPSASRKPRQDQWMQVNATGVDELCERLAGFSMTFRSLRYQLNTHSQGSGDLREALEEFERQQLDLEHITSLAWSLRLQPVEPMLQELGSHARDLALSAEKKLKVVVQAGNALLERRVLDALWDPLVHLVRNSVDHGLERPSERGDKPKVGTLLLRAETQGPSVMLTIQDDGRGINAADVRAAAVRKGLMDPRAAEALSEDAALDLVFAHGFSTRAEVSEISGRGVGLDVVRRAAEQLGGSVVMRTQVGHGTTFRLGVPATITKERLLVLEFGGVLFGIPSRDVVEVIRLTESAVQNVGGGRVVRHRDQGLPLRSLSAALGEANTRDGWALIVESGNRSYALGTPMPPAEHELVRRPVDRAVAVNPHIGASATLDDGQLVLVVSLLGLLRKLEGGQATFSSVPTSSSATRQRRARVLVVDDSMVVRDLVAEMLGSAGMEVRQAGDGQQALKALEADNAMDVVVSDVDMPHMNGFTLLKEIRARWPNLPVIMLTTHASAEDRKHASALGADAYMVKSQFEEAALVGVVRRYCGGRA